MEVSRRDFLRKAGMTAGLFTAPVSLPLFLAKEAQADPMTNEFKGNEIECNFTYIYNDKVSMVVDIIRHYKRIVFRGFIVAEGETYDFSRLKNLFPFPRPNEDPPFYCSDPKSGDMVSMGDLSDYIIKGDFKTHPVSFNLKYDIQDYRFSSLESGLGMDEDIASLMSSWVSPTKLLPLLHEDYPLITVKEGEVKFKGKPYDLKGARGAMAHHWGWAFPNYVFLMCNGFEDPNTLLTLSYTEAMTALGSNLLAGYLYYVPQGKKEEKKEFVSPINSSVQYFLEDGLLCIIARRPGGLLGKREIIRVNIDYKNEKAKRFPNFFNTTCTTIVDVPCEIIDVSSGKSLGKSTRAVLDVKGFTLPT